MEKEQFILNVASSMRKGLCDLFVGAGISAPSGLPTWSSFLQPFLKDIDIQIRDGDDYPLLAQYIVNHNIGNRNILIKGIHDTFGGEFPTNSYHNTLSALPVSTIWTTNYDDLLEKAFSDRNPRVIISEGSLLHPYNPSGIEIIKLHGDAKNAAKGIVLTRDDYNNYFYSNTMLSQRLSEAIINRSILFLGYSYQDSDIQSIMAQATHMKDDITNSHYILLADIEKGHKESDEEYKQRKRRFELWISELNRIGILECVVPKSEIGSVLSEIEVTAREQTIFVTGSHNASSKEKELASEIGRSIAEIDDVILNCGQSSGIGDAAMSGFMTRIVEKKQDLIERVRIYPNPYSMSPAYADDPSLLPSLKNARTPVIASSAVIIAFPGGMGTEAEIDLALAKERLVIPVIIKKSDYKNSVIKKILSDTSNMNQIKNRTTKFYDLINTKKVDKKMILLAIQEVINGKK